MLFPSENSFVDEPPDCLKKKKKQSLTPSVNASHTN